MKNKFTLPAMLILALNLLIANTASAQKVSGTTYNTGLGIRLDLGNGATFVGPAVKHFFTPTNAGEFSVLFGNHTTLIGAEYSYNAAIANAGGLMWNAGFGPQVALYSGDYGGGSDVFIRPFAGLEFKVPGAPLDLGFDWRPIIQLTHGSDFEAGRFGLAFRFALN